MEDINYVLLVLRWVHILAAIALVGGAVFMRFALVGAADETLDSESHAKLREAVLSRWRRVVHAGLALLLITGGINFALYALPPALPALPYHPIFGAKLLLAFAVFFLVSILVGTGTAFPGIRGNRARSLSIVLALAATIVLLSGALNQIRTGPVGDLQTTEDATSAS